MCETDAIICGLLGVTSRLVAIAAALYATSDGRTQGEHAADDVISWLFGDGQFLRRRR